MKKKFLLVLILITISLLISSCGMRNKINDLGKLYENNKNTLVFTAGITKDNKTYLFKDLIAKEVKSNGKKLRNERFYPDYGYLSGDLFYFVFQYYSLYEKEGHIIYKHVNGFININDLSVKLIKFYENEETINIKKIDNKIVFLENSKGVIYDGPNNIKTFDLNGYKGSNNIYSKQLILHKEDSEYNYYWVIDNDLNERKFTVEKNAYLYYIDDDYLIYSKEGKYIGINIKDNIEIETEKLDELVLKVRNIYNVFIYKDRLYNFYIEDQYEDNYIDSGFLTIESGDFKRFLTITMLRQLVPEVIKTEEIFNTEIYFKEVIAINDNIYISLVNSESFFGMYSGRSCPTIVLKYDIAQNSFEYIGYYGSPYYNLVKIIETIN